ncbi:hypothetical protein Tco_0599846 [Tanacetum coccineum]
MSNPSAVFGFTLSTSFRGDSTDEVVSLKIGIIIAQFDFNAVRDILMLPVQVHAVEDLLRNDNVVAFLEKPVESDGFTEIIDFLKASSVHYALTVNPIIYTSCIEQFWATTKDLDLETAKVSSSQEILLAFKEVDSGFRRKKTIKDIRLKNLEMDIQEKDKKSSQKQQNQARNGKA